MPSAVKRLGYRYQRTIARPVELMGVGFLTGASIRIRFRPAEASTGVVFIRTDLQPAVEIPATVDQVTGSDRRTTLGKSPAHVALVEHVLAALYGLRIDNCHVEVNAPEPPGLDGSAQRFVNALLQAGIVLQSARRPIFGVTAPIVVRNQGATLALHPQPGDELKISYLLDYGLRAPIARQICTEVVSPERFARGVAGCRTFLLENEAMELRRQGLGARTTVADLLVFGRHGPIDNTLRFANEPARHKILDLVGDLSLFGRDLRGHVVAYRSGHPLNAELVRLLSRRLESAPELEQSEYQAA
jgi:UDP-3-O-acyl N-acetylglucosamine deacetylase